MRARTIAWIVVGAGCALVPFAHADWNPGDPHKMHWPQLPDPQGWDVNMTWPKVLADDWRCSQTGPVSDIHFWFSWEYDQPAPIEWIDVSIHSDIPATPGSHSRPGDLLWARRFMPSMPNVRFRPYGQGPQGWYDPKTGLWRRPDHLAFYQANIDHIDNPFIQQQGTIYWLDLSIKLPDGINRRIGWKTSRDHFNDDAVWQHRGEPPPWSWNELRDPITHESLDLAFVITPAPGTVALLGLASIMVARRRR
ncbi:MAG: hypothetical protein FJ255_03220 [Phycisphaerae bacterium]|nr:hypothetical protein [Phycisphaerae bacterium]